MIIKYYQKILIIFQWVNFTYKSLCVMLKYFFFLLYKEGNMNLMSLRKVIAWITLCYMY